MICNYCSKEFIAKRPWAKYCSSGCSRMSEYYRNIDKIKAYREAKHRETYVKKPRELWNKPMPLVGEERREAVKRWRANQYKKDRQNSVEVKKQRARSAAMNAFIKGEILVSPCACGCREVEMHHNDYNKPKEIVWMCKKCHAEWHKNNNPILPTAL